MLWWQSAVDWRVSVCSKTAVSSSQLSSRPAGNPHVIIRCVQTNPPVSAPALIGEEMSGFTSTSANMRSFSGPLQALSISYLGNMNKASRFPPNVGGGVEPGPRSRWWGCVTWRRSRDTSCHEKRHRQVKTSTLKSWDLLISKLYKPHQTAAHTMQWWGKAKVVCSNNGCRQHSETNSISPVSPLLHCNQNWVTNILHIISIAIFPHPYNGRYLPSFLSTSILSMYISTSTWSLHYINSLIF